MNEKPNPKQESTLKPKPYIGLVSRQLDEIIRIAQFRNEVFQPDTDWVKVEEIARRALSVSEAQPKKPDTGQCPRCKGAGHVEKLGGGGSFGVGVPSAPMVVIGLRCCPMCAGECVVGIEPIEEKPHPIEPPNTRDGDTPGWTMPEWWAAWGRKDLR